MTAVFVTATGTDIGKTFVTAGLDDGPSSPASVSADQRSSTPGCRAMNDKVFSLVRQIKPDTRGVPHPVT